MCFFMIGLRKITKNIGILPQLKVLNYLLMVIVLIVDADFGTCKQKLNQYIYTEYLVFIKV